MINIKELINKIEEKYDNANPAKKYNIAACVLSSLPIIKSYEETRTTDHCNVLGLVLQQLIHVDLKLTKSILDKNEDKGKYLRMKNSFPSINMKILIQESELNKIAEEEEKKKKIKEQLRSKIQNWKLIKGENIIIPIDNMNYYPYREWDGVKEVSKETDSKRPISKIALWLYSVTKGKYAICYHEDGSYSLVACDVSNDLSFDVVAKGEKLYETFKKVAQKEKTKNMNTKSDPNIDANPKSTYKGRNILFYGAPGTGKSRNVSLIVKGNTEELSVEDKNIYKDFPSGKSYRVTFHPETDYSTFVGCYKPKMKGERIEYKFVPQAFMKAYISAWKKLLNNDKDKQVYLVIEELNRGNCAQIFGDIFQLLDRDKEGKSKYLITPDSDIIDWMKTKDKELEGFNYDAYKKELCNLYNSEDDAEIIDEGALALPNNLTIFATMNTSDQSLYPMDSAFKRRWEWKYVKVDYDNEEAKKKDIVFKEKGEPVKWIKTLKAINKFIKDKLKSTDKQMGEFFLNPDSDEIPYADFRDKVLFYLFNDAFKDDSTLAKDIWGNDGQYHQFVDLFEQDENIIYKWLDRLLEVRQNKDKKQ